MSDRTPLVASDFRPKLVQLQTRVCLTQFVVTSTIAIMLNRMDSSSFLMLLCSERSLMSSSSFFSSRIFRQTNSAGITIFYDSVCGRPIFQAPIGRTYDEWVMETTTHGWPSFRRDELIMENIVFDGEAVYSSCGTYLGGNLPDANGDRYCIDLSCISGNP
jgi:hypothetical protein